MEPHRKSDLSYGLAIILIFTLSRTIFASQGGSFIDTPLYFAKQYLDPLLLKNDLLRSLFYLHSQPPLFNLFLGLILKVSPLPSLTFEILFKTAGVLMPLLFFSILTTLGIPSLISFAAAVLFMLNPTVILYENLLYYSYPVAFTVLLAIFFLLQWTTQKRLMHLLSFWTTLLCLGMMRSLFHPLFFLLITVLLAIWLGCGAKRKKLARQFITASLIVLIPMGLLCIKNACVFGFFGTSSWDGMSLWIKVDGYAPEQLEEFYADGLVSQKALLAGLKTFQPIGHYYNQNELDAIPCHHPSDCSEWKSSGKPNFNHSGYVRLSKQLWKDALSLIRVNPTLFAFYTTVSYSLMLWYSSDSVHALFMNNMLVLERLEELYRFLYFGFLGVDSKRSTNTMWWVRTSLISLVFLFFYGCTVSAIIRRGEAVPLSTATVCLFCLLIHAYTLFVSSMIEFGENNRFRFPVDAAFLILMIAGMTLWKKSR